MKSVNSKVGIVAIALLCSLAGGTTISLPLRDSDATAYAQALPTHKVPAAQQGGVVLQLCDGASNTEVKACGRVKLCRMSRKSQ